MTEDIKTTVPGIVKVRAVRCADLPQGIPLLADNVNLIPVLATAAEIALIDIPECKITSSSDAGNPQEEAVLTFTATRPPLAGYSLAYILTDAAGNHTLLGAREWPRPITEVTMVTGTPGGDARAYEVKVTYTSRRVTVPCFFPEKSAKK